MKSAQLLTSLVAVALVALVAPVAASAGMLQSLTDTLSTAQPSTPSDHTFNFTITNGGTILGVKFQFCGSANTSDSCASPTSGASVVTNAALGSVSGVLGTATDWTLGSASGSTVKIAHTGAGVSGAGSQGQLTLTGIANPAINNTTCAVNGNNSSATCYVWISTTSDTSGTAVLDSGVASYTVIENVTVSGRVDPSFTFTVEGVDKGFTNARNNNIATSVSSTYNTLPFGDLAVNTPKYAAHALKVRSNAQGGYTVKMRMQTQMTGTYTVNNIDPLTGSWGTPISWPGVPTGTTANIDTGWIGANTTVMGGALFGPVNSTAQTVMQGTGSSDGTTPSYVTYAVEVNVYQPADTYTGSLVYNALPTY